MNAGMYLWIAFCILNIYGFLLMRYDKKLAKQHAFRISERKLFLYAFLGSAIGMYFAMQQYRHKTQHVKFQLGIPLCIIWNLALYTFLYRSLPVGGVHFGK